MRTLAVLGLAASIGCVSSDPPDETVEYFASSAVAVGDDIVVAMQRRLLGEPEQIVITRVHGGAASPLSPALSGDAADKGTYEAQLAQIDGRAYLTYDSDLRFHGAPLGADDKVDPATIIDLGFEPALIRVGNRFAAVSYPDHGFSIFLPVDTYHATFVTSDGHRDGELDVATEASPITTLGLVPRCAGNAKLLALPYLRRTFTGFDLFVSRVDESGALLDGGALPIVSSVDGQIQAGDAQLTVTEDGGVVVVYELFDRDQSSIHAVRIEPGAAPARSDRVIDLARVPSFLVTSGDRILAVSAPVAPGHVEPTFESFETRILDDHGRPLAPPITIVTGDLHASVIATPSGFAVLHGGGGPETKLMPVDRDGRPGESITLAASHQALPNADPGGCSSGRGSAGPGVLLLVLLVGWWARSARRTDTRIASTCRS
jgi:hypothetical protein